MSATPARMAHAQPIRLRELGAGEYDVLDAVFAGLSPTSRYRRFHGGTPWMAPLVRDRLAAVDGRRHVAVAAFADTEPIGIARLIALSGPDPGGPRADLAVEVVDAWQRRGIGSRLVRSVVMLGRSVGHTGIVADVLAENVAAQLLVVSVFQSLTYVEDGPEITFTADLSAAARAGVRAA